MSKSFLPKNLPKCVGKRNILPLPYFYAFIALISISILKQAHSLIFPTSLSSNSIASSISSLSSLSTSSSQNKKQATYTNFNLQTKHQNYFSSKSSQKRKTCNPCEDPNEPESATQKQSLLDQREAGFTMIGNLWSRGILPASVLSTLLSYPPLTNKAPPANAIYGSDANIQLLNVMDLENQLYKGAEGDMLLTRLEASTIPFSTIPTLLEEKQWSNIVSVITGPIGTLVSTLKELGAVTNHSDAMEKIVNDVQSDLFAIASAIERRQKDLILKYHRSVTDRLVAFVAAL